MFAEVNKRHAGAERTVGLAASPIAARPPALLLGDGRFVSARLWQEARAPRIARLPLATSTDHDFVCPAPRPKSACRASAIYQLSNSRSCGS